MGRLGVLVLGLAALSPLAVGQSAYASTTYADTISGTEVAATSSQGTFVGAASGRLPGIWLAVINHGPLPDIVGATGTITSGSFALQTVLNGRAAVVDGTLVPNPSGITMLDRGGGCRNQKFSIADTLSGVGVGGGGGHGSVSAVLTHYRARVLGRCITYAASVAGAISLTIP